MPAAMTTPHGPGSLTTKPSAAGAETEFHTVAGHSNSTAPNVSLQMILPLNMMAAKGTTMRTSIRERETEKQMVTLKLRASVAQ